MHEGMLEIGFALEQEVLKITEAGFGTCWLGTYDGRLLADRYNLASNEKIGIAVAVGVAKDEEFINTQFRKIAGSTKRRSIQEICLNYGDINLDMQIIEMIELSILAPSPNILQPVRVAIENNRADFYLNSDSSVDAGIFMSHFYLCAVEIYKEVKVIVEQPKEKCYNVDDSSFVFNYGRKKKNWNTITSRKLKLWIKCLKNLILRKSSSNYFIYSIK